MAETNMEIDDMSLNIGSRIFSPYRVIGLVTDSVPFCLLGSGTNPILTVSTGKSFQIRSIKKKLNIIQASKPVPHRISALTHSGKHVFVAGGNNIYKFGAGRLAATYPIAHRGIIHQLLILGEYLLSLSTEDNSVRIWNRLTDTLENEIHFDNSSATWMMHPDTYLNKIVVGFQDGTMQLWNIKTQKKIFTFENLLPKQTAANSKQTTEVDESNISVRDIISEAENSSTSRAKQFVSSPITRIEQSPAIDVVAIGYADGNIVLHNLRLNKTVVRFRQTEGFVTSMAFRSDEVPLLATGTVSGSIILWDLSKKKLFKIVKNAHDSSYGDSGTVVSLGFLTGQPIMISSGGDNSIKMWIFDNPDGSCRVLKQRAGPNGPITNMSFYRGRSYHGIITTSADGSVRLLNTTVDSQNFELSQLLSKRAKAKNVSEDDVRLNPVEKFAFHPGMEGKWDSFVTCHKNDHRVFTWNIAKRKLGSHEIELDEKRSASTSVAVSTCGNFVIIGSALGHLHRFNIQSGQFRGKYQDSSIPSQSAHSAAITGLKTDILNKHLISTSLDGTIKIWSFYDSKLLHTIHVGVPITKLYLQRNNNLIGVACDDLAVRMYDLDTLKLVRYFDGPNSQITDFTISPDCRLLLVTSTDQTVRAYDIPSGHLVDWFSVDKTVTGITFSSNGDLIATSHVGSNAVYLWSNLRYYTHVILRPIDASKSTPAPIVMPTRISREYSTEEDNKANDDAESKNGVINELDEDEDEEEDQLEKLIAKRAEEDLEKSNENIQKANEDSAVKVKAQLSKELITFSNEPNSKWQNIVNVELIKKRNKPQQPISKPESAPFFLPTLPGLAPEFAAPAVEDKQDDVASRFLSFGDLDTRSKLSLLLEKGETQEDYAEASAYLKTLSPSGIDFEMQTMSLANDYRDLKAMIRFLINRLELHTDFELVQAYMNVFLKHHGDTVAQDTDLKEAVVELKRIQKESWFRLQNLMHNNLCLIRFFSGLQA